MDRRIAPPYFQADHLDLLFPEKISLQNGVDLFLLRAAKDESIKLDIDWHAGSRYQRKLLMATFASKLIMSGTNSRTSMQLSEEIDFYGGYLSKSVDKDNGSVTIYALNENITPIFDTFSDAFDNCTFPQDELEKERSVALNQFRVNSQKVKDLCRRAFNKALFGTSPYGQVAEEPDFERINRDDIVDFYADFYKGTRPTIFLVGQVEDRLIDQLNEWSKGIKNHLPDNALQLDKQKTGLIHETKEGALQSAVRVGRLLFGKNHPDYFNFQVLNTVLGGYFGSRLMANIREDKGYTYGIGSGIAVMQNAAYFFISTEVAAEFREKTIDEIFHEIDRLKNGLVADDELMKVKNYLLGEFLRQCDGAIPMMECFKNIYHYDLKYTYYTDFIKAINACTAQDLMDLANKYLIRDEMVVVTAG